MRHEVWAILHARLFQRLGSPVILKTPDGSFRINMVKAQVLDELKAGVRQMFEDTALIIAQEFPPTKFDWRTAVLNDKPLCAGQDRMARGHWQTVKYGQGGKTTEGGFTTMPVEMHHQTSSMWPCAPPA